jgi:hypothetical protein
MAKHDLPSVSEVKCKFCGAIAPVVKSDPEEYKYNAKDQWLGRHIDPLTDWPCTVGAGLALHENNNGVVGNPNYPTVYDIQRKERIAAKSKCDQ